MLVGIDVGHAEVRCDLLSAELIWQDTHRSLHVLFGASIPAPRFVLYADRHDLPDNDELATFGHYDREARVLHVACQDGNADVFEMALRHEATHHYLLQAFGALPTWLNEGIATYMEAGGGNQGATADYVNKRRLKEFVEMLKWSKVPPLGRLLAWHPDSSRASQYYAAYWALVYALMHHPEGEIQQQRRQLLWELLHDSRQGPEALRHHLADGLLKENPSLADWELRWRRQIWDLRQ